MTDHRKQAAALFRQWEFAYQDPFEPDEPCLVTSDDATVLVMSPTLQVICDGLTYRWWDACNRQVTFPVGQIQAAAHALETHVNCHRSDHGRPIIDPGDVAVATKALHRLHERAIGHLTHAPKGEASPFVRAVAALTAFHASTLTQPLHPAGQAGRLVHTLKAYGLLPDGQAASSEIEALAGASPPWRAAPTLPPLSQKAEPDV
jgi:hypothetical protein